MSSEEESLTGFAGFADFREINNVSFGENRFVTAVVVSALLHVFLFLTLMAYAELRAPDDVHQVSPPVIHASLVFPPQASKMTPLSTRGKNGERSGSYVAAVKNAIPVNKPFSEEAEEKKISENPSSSQPSPVEEKIVVKPPAVSSDLVENMPAVKPSEMPANEGKVTFLKSDDFPAAGGVEFNGGKGGSAGKIGNGLRSDSGGKLSSGNTSGVESGAGGSSGSGIGDGKGEYGNYGGGLFSKNSAAIPHYRDNTPPVYPPLARRRGHQGLVVLIVEVLADGRPGEVRIGRSSGYEILDNAAQKAATRWSFEPGRKNGKAVRMLAEVPVRFVLNE